MKKQIVSISKGNSKMGAIPSVSLPACITCNPNAPCFKLCYAAKITRLYKTVKTAYENNLSILTDDPIEYWDQVKQAAQMARYFRYHVSGDIPNIEYYTGDLNATQQHLIITAVSYTLALLQFELTNSNGAIVLEIKQI